MWTEDDIKARDNGGHMHANTAEASLPKAKKKGKPRCAERSNQKNGLLWREKNRLQFPSFGLSWSLDVLGTTSTPYLQISLFA